MSRNAKPVEKMKDAYRKFMVRTMRRSTKTADEVSNKFCLFVNCIFPKVFLHDNSCSTYQQEQKENELPSRSFGTILSRGDNSE